MWTNPSIQYQTRNILHPVAVWGGLGATYGSRRLEIYLFNAYSAIREGLLLAVHLVLCTLGLLLAVHLVKGPALPPIVVHFNTLHRAF